MSLERISTYAVLCKIQPQHKVAEDRVAYGVHIDLSDKENG